MLINKKIDENVGEHPDEDPDNSNKYLSLEKKLMKKMSHSVEKSRNLTQRAFSAGNLITHKTSKKTPCEMNDP